VPTLQCPREASGFRGRVGQRNDLLQSERLPQGAVSKGVCARKREGLGQLGRGRYFEAILESLNGLRNYNVSWQILDTRDHGVPQTRQRIYIIGIRKDRDRGTFAFPEPLPWVSIERFLDPRKKRPSIHDLPPRSQGTAYDNVQSEMRKISEQNSDPLREAWLIDCDSTRSRTGSQKDRCPCITARRGDGHWISNRGRRTNKKEMMRLQGMDPEGFSVAVRDKALGKQIGNAMSCNVLERIFVRLLPAAGLYPQRCLHDRWEGAAAPGTPPKRKRAASPPRSPIKQRRAQAPKCSDLPRKVSRSRSGHSEV